MRLIVNIFERYTSSVANTFIRLSTVEADANLRTFNELMARRAERSRLLMGGAETRSRPALLSAGGPSAGACAAGPGAPEPRLADFRPPAASAIRVATRKDVAAALDEEEKARRRAMALAARTRDAIRAGTTSAFPLGVRVDVVLKYVEALRSASASPREILEKLRKDKKARVAELQFIAAEVLCEEPIARRKAEHLEALRAHFVGTQEARLRSFDPHAAHPV